MSPFLDDYDDGEYGEGDDDDLFDCLMGSDGLCGKAGSEECDWSCPTMRAFLDGSLP